jgi:hypothetical protein
MFAEATWDKVVYDVFMALLTGIFAGFFVDAVLRRRERARSLQVRHILNSELSRLTDDFLLATLPPEGYIVSPRYCIFTPDLEIYLTTKPADVSMYKESTDAHQKLWKAARSHLPNVELEKQLIAYRKDKDDLPVLRRLPAAQIEQLRETKKSLESVYQRYGSYLTPEISGIMATLYSEISNAIALDASEIKEDELVQSAYTSALMRAWGAANQILSTASEEGMILSAEEYMARSDKRFEDLKRKLSRAGINLKPPSRQDPAT